MVQGPVVRGPVIQDPVAGIVDSEIGLISPPLPDSWPRFEQPLRLGVMASGQGSNLAAIAESIHRGDLHGQIQVVVYNNPGARVADRAAQLGIPTILLNHRHYPSREALDQDIIQTLQAHGADWVIMAGWMRCVTQMLIDAFPQRVLNIHPSLLPSFPGLRAVEQALAAGVKLSGCTVHQVELEVDSGPLIMQAAVPVRPDDTAATLQTRIQAQEHRIYPAAIALAASLAEG
ncbi:MAG: phosphoribosylglycinamide formyltransferase [Nodosilinea sp.]